MNQIKNQNRRPLYYFVFIILLSMNLTACTYNSISKEDNRKYALNNTWNNYKELKFYFDPENVFYFVEGRTQMNGLNEAIETSGFMEDLRYFERVDEEEFDPFAEEYDVLD